MSFLFTLSNFLKPLQEELLLITTTLGIPGTHSIDLRKKEKVELTKK